MKDLALALLACLLLVPAPAGAGKKEASAGPPLPVEHKNAAGTLTFHTPSSWVVEARGGLPELTEARGNGLIVRIVRREGEQGLDSLHVECMLVRLAGPMEAAPQVDYEYDFVGGEASGRRVLDSAFVVHYDEPIEGQRDWRQRNLTVVGNGESLCLIGYSPLATWKKSKPTRALLDAVLASVRY
jgi:hypothetical protein